MSSPGVIVDRGIHILRASLWAGAAFDFAAAAWLGVTLLLAGHPQAQAFYSAGLLLALALATLGAVRLTAAYAPYGNRRLVRVLAVAGIAIAGICWWLPPGTMPLAVAGTVHSTLAIGLLLGLRLARL